MAYRRYDKLWRSEFFNNVSEEDRVKDITCNQLKLKVGDASKKDETVTTKSELSDGVDVVVKAYLVTKLSKREGHKSFREKIIMKLRILKDIRSMFQPENCENDWKNTLW